MWTTAFFSIFPVEKASEKIVEISVRTYHYHHYHHSHSQLKRQPKTAKSMLPWLVHSPVMGFKCKHL